MILTGTAGYSYKDWIGPFYPEGTKSVQMLEYYALHFNFVEINSSYYHMPGLKLFESLHRKTNEHFKFAVKLFGGFTHERNCSALEASNFMYAVRPVVESGKLLCLLAQFPYSFHFTPENLDHLRRIREWFKDTEINIEFRNQQWINSVAVDLLRKENLGFVCVDEPAVKGLIKNVIAATSNIAYVRFHGRNADKWYSSEGSERYNYLYRREELLEWVAKIRELDGKSQYTVISFNNHPMGKAVENARIMMEMLDG